MRYPVTLLAATLILSAAAYTGGSDAARLSYISSIHPLFVRSAHGRWIEDPRPNAWTGAGHNPRPRHRAHAQRRNLAPLRRSLASKPDKRPRVKISAAAISGAAEHSRTAGGSAPSADGRAQAMSRRVPVREDCPSARKAIGFYRARYNQHRAQMGLSAAVPRVKYGCGATRRRAAEWRARAYGARQALAAWLEYHYAWWKWMPDKWQRVGACETGYGKRPGRFDWNSGTYQGFAGFYYGSWDRFVSRADPKAGPYPSEAYLATPRQQYEVALAIWRAYGFSGWGCRNA